VVHFFEKRRRRLFIVSIGIPMEAAISAASNSRIIGEQKEQTTAALHRQWPHK
jgi:hypothetical protein